MELDFEIDKITESIEDSQTGEVYKTFVFPVTQTDLKEVNSRNGWLFNWKFELSQPERKVFKLVTEKEPKIIQSLVSFEKKEGFVFMHLIESAPFNIGKTKKYLGVVANLIAYVCKSSMEYGFDGVFTFEPKTVLISHYEKTLGAIRISERRMAVFEERAKYFVNKYFPEYEVEDNI
jgi:hypothetical protein